MGGTSQAEATYTLSARRHRPDGGVTSTLATVLVAMRWEVIFRQRHPDLEKAAENSHVLNCGHNVIASGCQLPVFAASMCYFVDRLEKSNECFFIF